MAQIKNLTATTPDATLTTVAKTGKYGSGGLAKLAHINDVIAWIKDVPVYADNTAAKAPGADLVDGDLYRTATGSLHIVFT